MIHNDGTPVLPKPVVEIKRCLKIPSVGDYLFSFYHHKNKRHISLNKRPLKKELTGLFVLSILLLVTACGDSSSDQTQFTGQRNFRGGGTTSVEVTPVQTGTISEQVRSYGTIQAEDIVSIVPQVSNRVTEIFVDLGDNVSQGQIMAKIYDVPFQDAVEQARAQIRQAQANLERDSVQFARQEQLFEQDLISRVEYDNARATYLNSRAQFESAQAALTQSVENLRNTEVRSPVFGVVLNRSISEGDLATTGQAMFEVANLTGFETRVFLPLEDWERVQVGQPVSMSLSGREADIAQGVVSRKSPQLDSTTGLGEVVITLTDAATSVYQGALVQTRINLETKEGVVVIPRAALVEKVDTYIEPETGTIELERTYSAFITQGDTAAVRKELVLGIEQGDRIEVLEGIAPGDKLVITGQQSLEDGSNIQIANAASLPGVTASADTSTTIQPQRAQNLSPEERRELRERLQNMTPEERREFREQREAQRQDTLAENVQSN